MHIPTKHLCFYTQNLMKLKKTIVVNENKWSIYMYMYISNLCYTLMTSMCLTRKDIS